MPVLSSFWLCGLGTRFTYQVLHTPQVVFNLVASLNCGRYLVTFSPLADNPEDPQVHCTVFTCCNFLLHLHCTCSTCALLYGLSL